MIFILSLLIIIGLSVVLYLIYTSSTKKQAQLDLNSELLTTLSIKDKDHTERQKEVKILKQLRDHNKCASSDAYPAINFWKEGECVKSDCMSIFKDTLKDLYETNEIPAFDPKNPTWTIGIWIQPKKLKTGKWENIFRFMQENPGSGKDRHPGMWLHPTINQVHIKYATKSKGQMSLDVNNQLEVNKWIHVVIVQNGHKSYTYINGKLMFANTQPSIPEIVSDTKLFIGPRTHHLVKNMTVCKTPLSMEGVKTLYNTTKNM